jgi:glycosyltransferase involved in cell wall biosynthesis
MRILWTSPHCRPDWLDRLGEESQGGQTVVMNKLPHALTRADGEIEVDIFTRLQTDDPRAVQEVKHLDDNPRVRLIRLPCGPQDRYIPKERLYGEPIAEFVEEILAFAERERIRYDLLHGHYADGWETVTQLKARWPHAPATLLTTHSLGRRKRLDGLERGEGTAAELDEKYNFTARIPSEERSLAAADQILPLSTPEAEILMEAYESVPPGDPRVTVFPNGISPDDFPARSEDVRRQLRADLGLTEETFLLLVPSRVDPRKGQDNILRSLEIAQFSLNDRSFRILFLAWPDPPTPYAVRLRHRISSADLGRWVMTHPPVSHERMPSFFAAADAAALPSQEYFSIAMLEAMLLGKPLIASVHSSGTDVITDGVDGLLVDHNEPADLGRALIELLEMGPTARQEMGRRARERVLQGYTWDRLAERLLRIYTDSSEN